MLPVNAYYGECENYRHSRQVYIIDNPTRNQMIVNIAVSTIMADKPTLVLVREKRHGALLREAINDAITGKLKEHHMKVESGDEVPVLGNFGKMLYDEYVSKVKKKKSNPDSEIKIKASVFLESSIKGKKRNIHIKAMRERKLACMIATSLADEGLDIQCLSVLIQAGGGRSAMRAMQRVGRVIRLDPQNPSKVPWVFDFIDKQDVTLSAQSRDRMGIYATEEEYIIQDMSLKKNETKGLKRIV
jgi:Lhr-like helicase